jgi:hypothetical protein
MRRLPALLIVIIAGHAVVPTASAAADLDLDCQVTYFEDGLFSGNDDHHPERYLLIGDDVVSFTEDAFAVLNGTKTRHKDDLQVIDQSWEWHTIANDDMHLIANGREKIVLATKGGDAWWVQSITLDKITGKFTRVETRIERFPNHLPDHVGTLVATGSCKSHGVR